jgi:quinol monooxygenase YgiN
LETIMNTVQLLLLSACASISLAVTPVLAQQSQQNSQLLSSSKTGLLVRLDAKKGMEAEVTKLLLGARAIVEAEPATTTWYAIQLSPTSFGIFDTFPNDAGREAHLNGGVPSALNALLAKFPDLLERPPSIEKIDVLAIKRPTAVPVNK